MGKPKNYSPSSDTNLKSPGGGDEQMISNQNIEMQQLKIIIKIVNSKIRSEAEFPINDSRTSPLNFS